jgi:hypothetical protein
MSYVGALPTLGANLNAVVAQLAEQYSCKVKVVSAILTSGTI